MDYNSSVMQGTGARTLEINKVLKNTYLLLSATLLFSAAMAGVAMAMNIAYLNPFIWLIGTFALMYVVHKTADSAMGLLMTFAFTGWMGFWLGPIISMYLSFSGAEIVMQALGGTALIFLAMSGYVLTTKKDFSFARGFFVAGIMTVFAVAVIYLAGQYLFGWQVSGLSLAISAAFMLLSSIGILIGTSDVIHGHETNYIRATVGLYVHIYNIFVSLLSILGFASDD